MHAYSHRAAQLHFVCARGKDGEMVAYTYKGSLVMHATGCFECSVCAPASPFCIPAQPMHATILATVGIWFASTPSILALRPRCLPCGCSQPPLLSRMVAALHGATGDKQLLCEAFPLLVAEHAYWTAAPKSVQVRKHHTCAVRVVRIMHGYSCLAAEVFRQVASRCLALV